MKLIDENEIYFKHKGHTITYESWREHWACNVLGKSNKSLEALKKAIDTFVKGECKFKNMHCIVREFNNPTKAIITSVDESGSCVWVRLDGGKRAKIAHNRVYADNEANNKLMQAIIKMRKEAQELTAEAYAIEKGFESLDIEGAG